MTDPSLASTFEACAGALTSSSEGSWSKRLMEPPATVAPNVLAGIQRPATRTPQTVPTAGKARIFPQKVSFMSIGMFLR